MSDDITEQELIDEQRRTLDATLSAAHLSLDLIGDIRDVLLTPLATINLHGLSSSEMEVVLEESQKASRRLLDRINFALTTQAEFLLDDPLRTEL